MATRLIFTHSTHRWFVVAALSLTLCGCGDDTEKTVAAKDDASGPLVEDGTTAADTGTAAVDAAAPVGDAGAQVADAGAPVVDAGSPVADAGAVVVDAAAPVADAGPTAADAGPKVTDAGPKVTDAGPKVTDAGSLTKNQCSSEQPCKQAICKAPGAFIGCGMCQKGLIGCKSDAECSAKKNGICIFKATDCTCDSVKLCHLGCGNDGDCKVGEVCTADHHCKAKPCKKGSDCPNLFACYKSSYTCLRKNCKKTNECGTGNHCVNKKCHDVPGTCQFPPP